jgi:hypothetical protein
MVEDAPITVNGDGKPWRPRHYFPARGVILGHGVSVSRQDALDKRGLARQGTFARPA